MVDKKILQDLAPRFTIGVLARKTGCHIETIRYYEKAGMLPHPARSEGGHRLYGSGHEKRLSFVMKARALGFTLAETRTLLGLAEREHPCNEARTIAAKHLTDVHAKIADLRTMETVLADLVDCCDTETSPDCPLIERMFDDKKL